MNREQTGGGQRQGWGVEGSGVYAKWVKVLERYTLP